MDASHPALRRRKIDSESTPSKDQGTTKQKTPIKSNDRPKVDVPDTFKDCGVASFAPDESTDLSTPIGLLKPSQLSFSDYTPPSAMTTSNSTESTQSSSYCTPPSPVTTSNSTESTQSTSFCTPTSALTTSSSTESMQSTSDHELEDAHFQGQFPTKARSAPARVETTAGAETAVGSDWRDELAWHLEEVDKTQLLLGDVASSASSEGSGSAIKTSAAAAKREDKPGPSDCATDKDISALPDSQVDPSDTTSKSETHVQGNESDGVNPASSDESSDVLNAALSGLSTRWKNWVIRGIFTWVMIAAFTYLIYLGPTVLMLLVLVIQVLCFHEIISIGYAVYRTHDLPWFRSLSWYLLFCSNYFFYGENMIDYFRVMIRRQDQWTFLVTYHRFISFMLYVFGFVWFVLSLVKTHYMRQFSLFAYTHVALLILVTQSHLIIKNMFQGLVWFLVPVSLIICNDIMAYMFGFFFGKTPLIKLSPKKTWEGFIGGLISTVVFGILMAYALSRYPFFVCPVEVDENGTNMDCEPGATFKPTEFIIPLIHKPVMIVPFQLHTLAMSLFSSIIGPFGGFFASGFKRAFKIKDFGALIPGHGGMMDRFDCQLIMATFVNVYISSFIGDSSPTSIVQQITLLRPEDQLAIYVMLAEHLNATGILQ